MVRRDVFIRVNRVIRGFLRYFLALVRLWPLAV